MARTAPVELTAEEAAAWRLAKLFDLRAFIGTLFLVFGVLVTGKGLTAGQAEIDRAAGINLALWVGLIMLGTAVVFLSWLWLAPPAPVTAAEAEAARRAAEEMGTSGGHH
jgi:hypothetical protein